MLNGTDGQRKINQNGGNKPMWHEGIIASPATNTIYKYWAKVYDEGSEFGINQGRISKLEIRKTDTNECVFNYDRGEDIPPANEEVAAVLDIILTKYAEEADAE
jgi:sporulation protein YlmC with PRC-barrel domain